MDWLDKLSLICGFISFAAFAALVLWKGKAIDKAKPPLLTPSKENQ
jgi:hypothetical protein